EIETSKQPEPPARARSDEVVLLVEDEDSLRDVIGSMLVENGYKLLCACDADSALATIDNVSRLDLILTDVVLPRGLSGPDLAAKVLKDKPETKVLYMSGYTDNVLLPNGELDPCVELLQKPFAMDSLVARMRKVLDQVS
ncbi:MAG: response regulator, partial [Gammaproteobacteria bacterium]|nr:response regulator [Gammaproteobacteria bacterium]